MNKEKHVCVYCGAPATHQFKNGKWCCQNNRNRCPAMKKIRSNKAKELHRRCKEKYGTAKLNGLKVLDKQRTSKYPDRGEHICVYCGGYAEYQLRDGRWCCTPKSNSCPVRRKMAANKRSSNGTPKRDYKTIYANLSEETKQKMAIGLQSKESHSKAANTLRKRYQNGELKGTWVGRHHTQDEINRIRETVTRYRIENGIWSTPRVSPVACKYIDQLNESKGWHLQHGMNGGEVSVGGYYLDGYDKKLNIAFEYDEPGHYVDVEHNVLREHDVIRMQFIKEKLGCRFFRFNEKMNDLYEC